MADQPQTVVESGGIRFEGTFRPSERAFLASEFGTCRFRLLARSALGADLALVEWSAHVPSDARGPRPIRAVPRNATYVLAVSGTGLRLDRVESSADLASQYPDHFPGATVRRDWRDWLSRALHDIWPALMLTVATIWVLATVWTCRPAG